ncbi:UbiA prenyltransferase family [Lactarius indigo]|nr:UbiA prenyltransferase family [Lactarius indigo]
MVVNIFLLIFSAVKYHIHTAILFTWTDYKTIFLPITVFACATAPLQSFSSFLQCGVWIWFHQLMCNVSNQARSYQEDKANRPWRPLPSGRISEPKAVVLRWTMVLLCILLSFIYDQDLVPTTLSLVAVTYTYDELGGASNIVGKALCTAGGYASFEVGATTIISANHALDIVSVTAVIISGILIFTVIQAQDFPDVEGDKLARRMTFPIYAPELSRFLTLFAIVAWSIFLSWFWGIGRISTALFISFGIHVGLRYYFYRDLADDRKSYLIFNVWLMAAHVLPLHARTSLLAL